MKTIVKLAVGTLVAVAIVASLVFLVLNGSIGSGQPQTDNSAALPNGSTNSQNENPTVTITYGKGATCPVGELYVDVHIKNDGYANFQPSGSSFELTMNNIVYHYWYSGSQLLGWQNVDIANGEGYDASIAFKVPDSSAPFVLSYDSTSTDYNIVCEPE
jgi:hypothetical protein